MHLTGTNATPETTTRGAQEPWEEDVSSLPTAARRFPGELSQAQQLLVHVLNNQGKVPRPRAQQDAGGDGQRGAVQAHLPQLLRAHSGDTRAWNRCWAPANQHLRRVTPP
jgi:hypothetical protein